LAWVFAADQDNLRDSLAWGIISFIFWGVPRALLVKRPISIHVIHASRPQDL
jgi:hypothetical protein